MLLRRFSIDLVREFHSEELSICARNVATRDSKVRTRPLADVKRAVVRLRYVCVRLVGVSVVNASAVESRLSTWLFSAVIRLFRSSSCSRSDPLELLLSL